MSPLASPGEQEGKGWHWLCREGMRRRLLPGLVPAPRLWVAWVPLPANPPGRLYRGGRWELPPRCEPSWEAQPSPGWRRIPVRGKAAPRWVPAAGRQARLGAEGRVGTRCRLGAGRTGRGGDQRSSHVPFPDRAGLAVPGNLPPSMDGAAPTPSSLVPQFPHATTCALAAFRQGSVRCPTDAPFLARRVRPAQDDAECHMSVGAAWPAMRGWGRPRRGGGEPRTQHRTPGAWRAAGGSCLEASLLKWDSRATWSPAS